MADGMPSRCNRYRIPLDTQPPRNERKRCNSEIDVVRSPFGHLLVGIILFRRKGLRSALLSLFSTPLQIRYTCIRAKIFLFFDFDDVEKEKEICISLKII